MLTREEQQQKDLPYGHGIGIAYYHTVAGQNDLAEQTLSSLIAYQPEKYGADVELARLYMSLKQYKTALRSIESSYNRGGDKNTGVVVSYAQP